MSVYKKIIMNINVYIYTSCICLSQFQLFLMKCEILVVIEWKKQSGSKGSFPTMNMITTDKKTGLRREDDWKSGLNNSVHIYTHI